jgi:hypothetical protein
MISSPCNVTMQNNCRITVPSTSEWASQFKLECCKGPMLVVALRKFLCAKNRKAILQATVSPLCTQILFGHGPQFRYFTINNGLQYVIEYLVRVTRKCSQISPVRAFSLSQHAFKQPWCGGWWAIQREQRVLACMNCPGRNHVLAYMRVL